MIPLGTDCVHICVRIDFAFAPEPDHPVEQLITRHRTAARAVALLYSAANRLITRDIVSLRDALEYTCLLIGEIDNSPHTYIMV